MQCVDFVGNQYWLVYEVNSSEAYPQCSGSFLYESAQSGSSSSSDTGTGITTDGSTQTIIVYEAQPAFDPSTIDTTTASAVFGAGFLLTIGPIVSAYVVRTIISMIRN